MNLILTSGFPFPYPPNLNEAQQATIAEEAMSHRLVIEGVLRFEQKHTTTVIFLDADACQKAMALTGWQAWTSVILEAPTSKEAGHMFPAIIAAGKAYSGYQLHAEPAPPLFYVRDTDTDQDLLVRAATAADALPLWRAHFELDPDAEPTYIGNIPLDIAASIPWDLITSGALQFKRMPE